MVASASPTAEKIISSSRSAVLPFKLTNQYKNPCARMTQDTVSGLYDFPAREYSIQGRWPSPDPAGLGAVDPTNPQSWNRYAYVVNNPLMLIDPTGLDCQALWAAAASQ